MNLRTNERISETSAVSVSVLDPPSEAKLTATVLGASHTQLRVVLNVPLARDAYLVVNLKNHMLFGEVVYCFPCSDAYEVGLLIQEAHCLSDLGNAPATLTGILEQEKIPVADYEPDCPELRESEPGAQWGFVRSIG